MTTLTSYNDPICHAPNLGSNGEYKLLKSSNQDISQNSRPNELEVIIHGKTPLCLLVKFKRSLVLKWRTIFDNLTSCSNANSVPHRRIVNIKWIFRTLKNKERINRIWLMYSPSVDAVFVSVVNFSIVIVKVCWLQMDSVHGNMFKKL